MIKTHLTIVGLISTDQTYISLNDKVMHNLPSIPSVTLDHMYSETEFEYSLLCPDFSVFVITNDHE